ICAESNDTSPLLLHGQKDLEEYPEAIAPGLVLAVVKVEATESATA
ncbi:hypothetical protein A2U01_0067974, partial [Trifolium medium]|nr:hypothetical protein [Trifolium medium]